MQLEFLEYLEIDDVRCSITVRGIIYDETDPEAQEMPITFYISPAVPSKEEGRDWETFFDFSLKQAMVLRDFLSLLIDTLPAPPSGTK